MAVKRKKPHVTLTIFPDLDAWLRKWAGVTRLSYSRIACEAIAYAIHHGYTPNTITMADLKADVRDRTEGL